MATSKSKGQLYCPIRKQWVANQPEEIFRQRLLKQMIEELGYPIALIGVEKEIGQLPHLTPKERVISPDRRVDIIVYSKDRQHQLFPLLTIECKAVKLTKKVISQVLGYNHFIRAAFIAVANEEQFRLGWYDPSISDYTFIDFLPSYEQLSSSLV